MLNRIKYVVRKLCVLAKTHKKISIALSAFLVLGGYWIYSSLTSGDEATHYILASAEKQTIISTVTGSGQVSASNQIDLKPKASGNVVYMGVTAGAQVKTGALIAQLDARDAQKAVRDAEVNLESAKLSLEKLQKPADTLSTIQAENTLARAKESRQQAEDDLVKAFEDGFNDVADAFLDLPDIMTGLQEIFYNQTAGLGNSGQNNISYYTDKTKQYNEKAIDFKTDLETKFQIAREAYDANFQNYKLVTRSSDKEAIEKIIAETYETAKTIAEATKSGNNLIQLYRDELTIRNVVPASVSTTHLANLNTYTGKINTHLSGLLAAKKAITDSRDTILNADRSIQENTESLAKLRAGADALDLKSAELTVQQRQNALVDAKEKLADYFIRAPFDGTVAKLNIKKADSVTSGTAVATFITKQQLAELSLNEVDVAKIKIGQKATLTFDAIEGLEISGSVVEIDTVGTVTQGVVTYNIKIGFDTQDDRIKPGMSTSASIITDVRQDVIAVPSAAVKSQGNVSYVEILESTASAEEIIAGITSSVAPRQQQVEVGISSDTMTEIRSGIDVGIKVVTRMVTDTTATTQQAPSLIGGGSGGVRIPR
ncbi:MAG: efflux RND transporter periplasmic adaptor subunit [Patescibacteria group bacterium]|mgnify:CR=1 FL=1